MWVSGRWCYLRMHCRRAVPLCSCLRARESGRRQGKEAGKTLPFESWLPLSRKRSFPRLSVGAPICLEIWLSFAVGAWGGSHLALVVVQLAVLARVCSGLEMLFAWKCRLRGCSEAVHPSPSRLTTHVPMFQKGKKKHVDGRPFTHILIA